MDFSGNARFGLENTISGAVSEYYDLLFDNVKEYIGMNREELKEYEAEDAELREKLENGNIGEAERKTLIENRKNDLEMIGNLREFLDSSLALEVGIKISGEMLDDNEPELVDRFNAAPAAEKYACLMARYMDEYRRDLAPRNDSPCVDADAFRHGAENVRELFPKLAEQYEEHKREEYTKLLAADPVRLHDDLVLRYSLAHVADAGRRLLELQHDHGNFQSGLREHDAAKPGWLKNLTTFGNAGKVWTDGREKLMAGEVDAGNHRERGKNGGTATVPRGVQGGLALGNRQKTRRGGDTVAKSGGRRSL